MNHCPKCGGVNIQGPRYHRPVPGDMPSLKPENIRYEFLRYTCSQCGYTRDDPTLDYKPPEPLPPCSWPDCGVRSIGTYKDDPVCHHHLFQRQRADGYAGPQRFGY